MSHTIDIFRILLNALRSHSRPLPNVVGIELLNEPHPPSDQVLKSWYEQAIKELTSIEPGLPIYIGECWRTESYADFVSLLPQPSFVILDHHLYRCFTEQDTSTSACEHARALTDPNGQTPQLFSRITQSVPMVIGEWSGALNPGSLKSSSNEHLDKKLFVEAQLQLFEKCCAGWFWWTYKKENRGDTGWSFRDAVEAGIFPSWVGMKAKKSCISNGEEEAWQRRRDGANAAALGKGDRKSIITGLVADYLLGEHTAYWSQFPGHYEHWRFGNGFIQGWDDAYVFFSSSSDIRRPVPELGFKTTMGKRRLTEHVKEEGAGKGVWEYGTYCLCLSFEASRLSFLSIEHGFSQGVDAAKRDFEQYYC
jgi:glucan 1,3-beta-glucosidase